MLNYVDSLWRRAGEQALLVAMVLMVLGITVSITSFFLSLHDVEWNGFVADEMVTDFPADKVKQVGFMWAPNWGLAAIILLPMAIYKLLLARGDVEPLIGSLVSTNMLRNINGDPIDSDQLMKDWKKETKVWIFLSLMLFSLAAILTLYGDFYQVVLQWLLSEEYAAELIADANNPVTFYDPTFEFDWSVAALFVGSGVNTIANIIFSFVAYLLVPVFGAGLLLSGFVWFLAFCTFFSPAKLRQRGMIIVPDVTSADKRLGFENFEDMFDHLVQAGIYTSILALSMHLQNVFLRSAEHETILDMVFGVAFEKVGGAYDKMAFGELTDYVLSVNTVINARIDGTNIQMFISALAMMLLALIVIGSIWAWLRRAALVGKRFQQQSGQLSDEELARLKKMKVWPVGWISINKLLIIMILVFASMYIVNLISFLSIVILVYAVGVLSAPSIKWFLGLFQGDDDD
ncbi:MAG: hypothetical protein GY947_18985 [Rhodobacteraceae bacterium]|nr:hypothetical protein [Paracoccaceae bacterium]